MQPAPAAQLVVAEALSADNVLAQLLGRLVITQPADGEAAPAEGTAAPADWQDARVTLGHFSNAVLAVSDADMTATRKHAAQWIDGAVVKIDQYLSTNVDAILHAPSFQKLEATWRSLSGLVANSETGTMLKLKVFNTRREELQNDLETAVEFDQSTMFKLIYEAEYGTYGGNPYSVLLVDFPISNSAVDIEFLGKLTQVAAAAHAPLLAGVDASMFGLKDFSQLAKPRDLQKIFEGAAWIPFNEFRQTEDSRYATLVLPRLLLRLPYDYTVSPVGFNYIEDISSDQHRPSTDPGNPEADEVGSKTVNIDWDAQFLWGNPAYALAQRITNAFSLYGWTAAIRGEEGGGMVDGLPLYQYRTDRGSEVLFCPTEVAITDRREKELSDLGFISLCHCKGSSRAVFFGGQTVNRPITYLSDEANANAQLSARLPYMLAASRFAHYVKVIMRKKIGGFLTRGNVEALLNTWITQYVLLDDNATQEVKASYPLRSAQIVVTDVPGSPGAYKATMFLKPHFQLEELTTSIRLVAELPAS
ncbi:type VI secretion system contractile sheath large subunit [Paraburkholderia solisilvae]